MNKWLFPRLAASNIRKNGQTYLPYLLTCVVTAAVFYIVKSLSLNPGLEQMVGQDVIVYVMYLGSWVVAFFACIFLFYTNSFLVRRRMKELALFNILGMEKRHLAKTLAFEALYTALTGIGGGLLLGVALDKAMFLLIAKVMGANVSLGFFVSPRAVGATVVLFAVIFSAIFLNTVRQLHVASPMELMRKGQAGEQEPKARWFLALAGILCVGSGYYLALSIENPVSALSMFFVAVLLVIAGTYLTFAAGSIAFLKLLRKNKRYYYRTRHFISVSGMLYRMKQNAVGLANICVLSTMVLVMISSTSSLMFGMEDSIRSRYPNDFSLYIQEDKERSQEIIRQIGELLERRKLQVTDSMEYTYLRIPCVQQEDSFQMFQADSASAPDSFATLTFLTLADYNTVMGTDETMQEDEILLYANRSAYDNPSLNVLGRDFSIKKTLKLFPGNGIIAANASNGYFLVVRDKQQLEQLYQRQKEILAGQAAEYQYYYGFDTDAGKEEQEAFYRELQEQLYPEEFQGTVESRQEARPGFVGLYGSFFFLGAFLGVLFLMAAVLIIYYKQISEGFDDKERYAIMQKVGLSRQEVRASIRSQVLTVFFLPLAAAGLHVAAAFPMISKLLKLLNLLNTRLFVFCTVGSYLAFAVMYVLVYLLTARTYYRLVR